MLNDAVSQGDVVGAHKDGVARAVLYIQVIEIVKTVQSGMLVPPNIHCIWVCLTQRGLVPELHALICC